MRLRGGGVVRSGVRVAASACVVLSGLLIAGIGGALAFADPDRGHGDSSQGSSHNDDKGSQQGGRDHARPDSGRPSRDDGQAGRCRRRSQPSDRWPVP